MTWYNASFFTSELTALDEAQRRITSIDSDLSEILEGLTESEQEALGSALNDAGDAFVAAKLRGCIRDLQADGDQDELVAKVKDAQHLLSEQKTLCKNIKEQTLELEVATKKAIESLTDQQARDLLDEKWNKALVDDILKLPHDAIDTLVGKVRSLANKYGTTFAEVDEQIRDAEHELVGMLNMLTGNEYDMAGINELAFLLGGEAR